MHTNDASFFQSLAVCVNAYRFVGEAGRVEKGTAEYLTESFAHLHVLGRGKMCCMVVFEVLDALVDRIGTLKIGQILVLKRLLRTFSMMPPAFALAQRLRPSPSSRLHRKSVCYAQAEYCLRLAGIETPCSRSGIAQIKSKLVVDP